MLLDLGVCTLRNWQAHDAAALVRYGNDRRIWLNLRDAFPHPYTPADAKRFLSRVREMEPQTFYAIAVGPEAVGGIGYTIHTDVERISAEIGYWLGVPYWGRGIMTEALRGLTDYAFQTHADLRRLYAVPYAGNLASARVLEKVGYRLEGRMRESAIKDGTVVDQLLYAKLRGE